MSPSSRPSGADWEQMAKEVLGDLFWNATTGRRSLPAPGNARAGTTSCSAGVCARR